MNKIVVSISMFLTVSLISCGTKKPTISSNKDKGAVEMVNKMLNAVNYKAWQELNFIKWTWKGVHHYVWDRVDDNTEVKWDKFRVTFNSKTEKGKVFKEGEEINDEKILRKAIDYFNNDSFWLLAFTKIKDEGTKIKRAKLKDGTKGLYVTYSSGGTTPGDSYFWILDENGLPKEWRMWVSVIPIGGFKTTWANWTKLHNGAMVAQEHKNGLLSIPITNLKSGDKLSDLEKTNNNER
jgi:hypothetical protein